MLQTVNAKLCADDVCEISFGGKSHGSRQGPEVATKFHYSTTLSIKPAPASHRKAKQGPPKGNPHLPSA